MLELKKITLEQFNKGCDMAEEFFKDNVFRESHVKDIKYFLTEPYNGNIEKAKTFVNQLQILPNDVAWHIYYQINGVDRWKINLDE
ncbi:hypothetical protein [Fredinandcohnia onubensis]|uniref:hypothetical protein n=1 Tax=Fredinandcohnia onubensis TaxID=1571209 RepID=UPI000C0BDB13|nr:hypothetical protein [Fredinandcohnia onubensis]